MSRLSRHLSLSGFNAASTVQQRAHAPDYQMIVYVGILMLLGLVVMYAIGPQRAQILNAIGEGSFSGTYFVVKQAVSLLVAIAAFSAMAIIPLSLLKRHAGMFVSIGLVACLVLFIFGNLLHVEAITQCTKGACRWFELGPLGSFQPAELLKFGLLILTARLVGEKILEGKLNDWQETIVPVLMIGGLSLFTVVVIQQDMGTGISLVAIITTIMMVAGIHRQIGFKLIAMLAALGIMMIVIAPHRIERVITFFQGEESSNQAQDGGYHIRHAKIAIGSGGPIGVGIGNSVQATGYLPETINDSMFAILGEMFGFLGLTVLIIVMTALLMRILRIADRLRDPWLQLLVAGTFGWLASHIVLNIASMVGVFPLTGITLPLLSFGGTSMVFIAAALGIVFQASRYTAHQSLKEETVYAGSDRGRRLGRTRDAGRRRNF